MASKLAECVHKYDVKIKIKYTSFEVLYSLLVNDVHSNVSEESDASIFRV
jgi:hypothetical protein